MLRWLGATGMSETYPWDNQEEIKPVDSAGCLFGETDRPAKPYIEWANRETQKFALKDPSIEQGWISSENPVSLGEWK